MNQTSPIRSLWASVRPRTTRGAMLGAATILLGAAVMAVGMLAAASFVWSPYLDFAANRDSNARQWAAIDMRFADSDGCAACHQPETTKLHAAPHQGNGCQSCHGALLGHATAEASAATSTAAVRPLMAAAVAAPTEATCLRCHLETAGRPGTLKQIVASQHYTAQCLECHDPHSSVAIQPPVVSHPLANLPACLTCHGPDGFKTRNLRHPSGALTDAECLTCHEAGNDTVAFAHKGFPLTGKHLGAACSACHTDMSSLAAFQATPKDCIACHQKVEPHKGARGTACGDCHNPSSWTDATIDHNVTGFKLVGQHANAACASCHKNGVWAGTPTVCASCHERPVNHETSFGSICSTCHTPKAWQPATFDHNARTPYKLTGVHVGAACVKCHTNPNSHAGAPTVCAGCHTKPVGHIPVASTVCQTCHSTKAWRPATFNHSSAFKLTGAHATVNCASCHKGGVYTGLPTTCNGCHTKPAGHIPVASNVCQTCHSTKAWEPATFNHSLAFKLTGAHTALNCTSCHKRGANAGLPTTCNGCHTKPAGHIPVASNVCQTCHSTRAWEPATFNHSSAFPLTGAHTTVNCASCHKGGVYTGLPTTCSGCHQRSGIHSPLYPATCTSCHSTAGWRPILYRGPHTFPKTHNGAGGRCITCHASSTVGYTCAACHSNSWATSHHQGVSGFSLTTCARCHPTGQGGG